MIELVIGNSVCGVRGVTAPQLAVLRDVCSYTTSEGKRKPTKDKRTGKVRWIIDVQKKRLMDKTGNFPTGLLYLIEDEMSKRNWRYVVSDTRVRPKLHTISSESLYVKKKFEPYPEQVEAAAAALEYGRGIVVGPTGVGKSAICELICDAFRVNTLIVVPTLELKRQLTATLREAFGKKMVGPLGHSATAVYPISVENVSALNSDVKLRNIDCVIIDEFHHSAATTYRELNFKSWVNVYFKIGLTATPFRANDTERLLLESVLSQVIYRIPYQTAVDKGYIVPLEVYYVDLPKIEAEVVPGTKMKVKKAELLSYPESYERDVVLNDHRNGIIADMLANLLEAKAPTLVLVKQIEHGNILRDLMVDRGIDVPFAEGTSEFKSSDIDDFNSGESDGLIGTTGVVGEGVDTKRAEWVILAGGGKSKNQFMQNLGRVFRMFKGKESGKVILFRDPNNRWLLEHFKKCLKYLMDEYGVTATKLDLNS